MRVLPSLAPLDLLQLSCVVSVLVVVVVSVLVVVVVSVLVVVVVCVLSRAVLFLVTPLPQL
jgi:hypothetical protein